MYHFRFYDKTHLLLPCIEGIESLESCHYFFVIARILHTFTQQLRSSGVDLSQAKFSVQIDVTKKRASNGSASSTSKVCLKSIITFSFVFCLFCNWIFSVWMNLQDPESAAQVGVGSYNQESDIPSHKRHRTENN